MAYSAFETMRQKNLERFGKDLGPKQPDLTRTAGGEFSLKDASLRFLHDRCEELLFDQKISKEEEESGIFQGTGIEKKQVPYNMQMDTNRLCLERSLEHFIDSGVAEDAYDVYFCYLEIFFGQFEKFKKTIELLSEFESNGSSLLMKHRDHYSHSVYVFALGLAIYETNTNFRKTFKTFYGFDPDDQNKEDDKKAAHLFLEYWGLTALFHDIGYPFELPFEQVMAYYEVDNRDREEVGIFLSYQDLDIMTKLGEKEKEHFSALFQKEFESTNELFAYSIFRRIGEIYGSSEDYLVDVICRKPNRPNEFGFFMDHAWFSAVRLYRELIESFGIDAINKKHMDALSAILLHNSLFKFAIAFYKSSDDKRKEPLRMDAHPLAFLLMICDELQCWDRTAYGRNSRTELHPMGADFDFSHNAIKGTYYYDADEQEKIDAFEIKYKEWENGGEQGKAPRLKAYSDMAEKEQRFTADIEKIVDTSLIPLTVIPDTRVVDRTGKHTYLSRSNFLHLYDFAVALNGRYAHIDQETKVDQEQLQEEFEALSLEYQISNINQAKSFSKYLNAIQCFYTDRPVDFAMVKEFTPEQTQVFAPMEHERWVREHQEMGWTEGETYEKLAKDSPMDEKALREQFRMHKLAMDGDLTPERVLEHYDNLSEDDKGKDWKPFNSMLKLIKKFDGLRIYQLDI